MRKRKNNEEIQGRVINVIDVGIIRNNRYNCIQNIIANVAKFYGYEYRLMFINSWGFYYKRDNNLFNDSSLLSSYGYGFINILKKFCKINIEKFSISSIVNFKATLMEELNHGYPVILYIDGFYCKWNHAFMKFHVDHYILIIGFDDNNNSINCIDPYCSDKVQYLEIEQQYLDTYFTIRFSNYFTNMKNDILSFIEISLEKKTSTESYYFKMLNEFLEDIQKLDLEISNICDSSNDVLYSSSFLRNIKAIGDSRYNYVEMLSYLEEEYYVDFSYFKGEISRIGNMWESLKQVTIKGAILKSSNAIISKLQMNITKIIEKEYRIVNELLVYLKQLK